MSHQHASFVFLFVSICVALFASGVIMAALLDRRRQKARAWRTPR